MTYGPFTNQDKTSPTLIMFYEKKSFLYKSFMTMIQQMLYSKYFNMKIAGMNSIILISTIKHVTSSAM